MQEEKEEHEEQTVDILSPLSLSALKADNKILIKSCQFKQKYSLPISCVASTVQGSKSRTGISDGLKTILSIKT